MNHALHAFQHELDPKRLVKALPDGPGVYLFKDPSGRVIYVGKAKSLRNRVLSYFRPLAELPHKTGLMVKKASGLDFMLTTTEKEAFILEDNLVKKYMPRYNIILRDDKRYPCLRFDIKEPYPRLRIVRKIKKDGAIYFGPFSSANAVRSTMKVIDRVFQLRKCAGKGFRKRTRPCLNYQMDRCLGPCTHSVRESDYHKIVLQIRLFLEGRNRELIAQLKRDMAAAAGILNFEVAARKRDQIRAIERTVERQHVVSPRLEDQDIIGLVQRGELYQVVILFVRKGCVVGSRDFLFRDPAGTASDVMEAFLKQYYLREAFKPKQILISEPIEDLVSITQWLSDVAGKKVVIHTPRRGEKLRMVKMAMANAENLLARHLVQQKEDFLGMVKSVLKLERVPRFIEGLDISNLQGDMPVGTIVSFVDGVPHGAGYRNFKIRAVNGIDDYGMMAELLQRRVSKGQLPDLFVVDGGKGHLAAVKKVLGRQENPYVPEVIAIAKPGDKQQEKRDKIYIPGRKNPLGLNADHPVLLLMMRIRDEAHRRALSYHRKLREKKLTVSELDLVSGIGATRKRRLLTHFKDITSIAGASIEELTGVPGIDRSLAENIYSFFRAGRLKKRGEKEKENGLTG